MMKGFGNVCSSLKFFSIVQVNETSVLWTVLTRKDKRKCQAKALQDNFCQINYVRTFRRISVLNDYMYTRVTVKVLSNSQIHRSSCNFLLYVPTIWTKPATVC